LNTTTTRDIIELDNDVNEAVKDILLVPIEQLTAEERSELCVAFVACTRHRYELINCKFLKDIK